MWYSEAGNQRGCRTSFDTSWVIQTNWYWPPSGCLVVWASRDWENHVGEGCRSSYNCCIYQGCWFRVCTEVLGRGKLFFSESWFYNLLLQVVRNNRNLILIDDTICGKVFYLMRHRFSDFCLKRDSSFYVWMNLLYHLYVITKPFHILCNYYPPCAYHCHLIVGLCCPFTC